MKSQQEETILDFEVVGVLGYGAHSTIFAARDPKTNEMLAIKRVIKDDPSHQRFVDQMLVEFDISQRIDCDTIRKCTAIKKKKVMFSVKEVYMLMEHVPGKNLVERKPEAIDEIIRIFIVVADSLKAMADSGYVHADMKPNNVILSDEGKVTVIDLGQSCVAGTKKDRVQGTPDYIAPEQVKRRPLTSQTDMFNFGASLYWCLTDHHIPTMIPKEGEKKADKKPLIPPVELRPETPHILNQLILECLNHRSMERPETWDSICERLRLAYNQVKLKAQ